MASPDSGAEDRRAPDGRRKRRCSGSNIVEFSLLVPWYVFLFAGAFDYGFFAYSLIATQYAASVTATYCAASSAGADSCHSDPATACGYALDQFRNLPNVGPNLTTCGTGTAVTSAAPVAVTVSKVDSPDNITAGAAAATVTYLTPQLIPIPGLLPGQLTIQRVIKMRLRA